MTQDEACERLNMAEDLLGCALAHLKGDPCYANKHVIIDYLQAYFDCDVGHAVSLRYGANVEKPDGTDCVSCDAANLLMMESAPLLTPPAG